MMQTCYRHPKRTTGASCTRCGRPICPDCMVQAPVGHHCPECVREGNKGVRQVHWRPSPTLGGRRATPVVRALIIVNAAVFLIARPGSSAWARFAQVPYYVARGQYERLLTAAFLHAGIAHIVFNMLALYIVGPSLESALGRVRFSVLYLLAALGGSVLSYLFSNPLIYGVGASGAIFGLFGAFFVIARTRKADTSGIVGLIVVNLVYPFVDRTVDWRAHVGGLVIGSVVAAGFALAETRPPSQRRAIEVGVVVAASALLVALIVVRTNQLRAVA
jgi:membrane associated rhomboid family serine protease